MHDDTVVGSAEVSNGQTAAGNPTQPAPSSVQEARPARKSSRRRIVLGLGALLVLAGGGYYLAPTVLRALETTSTDDAYVNGHVTFVAPRVQGQVARVLVDDNMRVAKGDLLVELDREPYQVQVDIKKAAVANAEADFKAAEAQVRANLGRLRSLRWRLQTAIEQVDNNVALLRARVATLRSKEATRDRARADLKRAEALLARTAIAREEFDQRREAERVAEALVNQALEEVSETRVSLGLPPHPEKRGPVRGPRRPEPDLLGRPAGTRGADPGRRPGRAPPASRRPRRPSRSSRSSSPATRRGTSIGSMERIVPEAPEVRQAVAKRVQAERDLAQAELDLRYCEVRAEIDGVVARRNVNPGNNVAAGQALMTVRSLSEIWIDANFKETQLADMRIGQRADLEVDMYGSRKVFRGRISGFTMGTGQTLALLPPQNATGNFVKIVQRLPVRIELEDYDPEKETLFVGLSVTPYVFVKEPPQGPGAGRRLQELRRPNPSASK